MSTLEIQCEQNEETQPKVVGVAAALLESVANDGATVNQIVKKEALNKLIEIAPSSPDYLADPDCQQSFGNLIETCANVDDLRGKREPGAVDLVMMAMNLNPNKEELQNSGQKLLQKLVRGDVQALNQTLKDYDKLLAAVVRRPEYTKGLG